jgi:hypothetical protein
VIQTLLLLPLNTLPLVDLPNHLAEATILQAQGKTNNLLSSHYTASRLSWYQPAIAHMVVCSRFPSVITGNIILYLLYVIALPASVIACARLCRGSPLIALLSVLLIWNANALWGFAGFTLALPVLILTLLMYLYYSTHRSVLNGGLLGVLLLVVYWFHALSFLYAIMLLVLIELYQCPTLKKALLLPIRLLPIVPTLFLFALWRLTGEEFGSNHTLQLLNLYYHYHYPGSFDDRLITLLTRSWSALTESPWIPVMIGMFIVILTVWGIVSHFYRRNPLTLPRAATLLGVTSAFACILFLPQDLPRQSVLYQRFVVLFFLWLIATLSWALPVFLRRYTSFAVVGLVAGYMLLTAHYFIAFRPLDRQFTRFFQTALATHQDPVAFVIDDPYYKSLPVFIHYNNYQIIWNKGPTPTCITQYRFGAIRSTETPLPGYCEWTSRFGQPRLFDTIEGYRDMGTLVVQGHRPRTLLLQRSDYRLEKTVGAWSRFDKIGRKSSH